VRIGDDEMMMARHDACGVEENAGLLQGESEAVGEDGVGFRARPETERALVAATRDQVRLGRNDSARVSHDERPESERRARRGKAACSAFVGRASVAVPLSEVATDASHRAPK